MNFKSVFAATAITVGLLAAAQTAQAALIVTPVGGNGGDNLVFNSCASAVSGPALTLSGCLNGQPTTVINLTSDENIQVAGGGQARVVASDGIGYSFLSINSITPATFSQLILNINATQAGSVTFTGSPGGTSSSFALAAGGQNFFTITGEDFDFVSFTTTGTLIADIVLDTRQIRLDTAPNVVPEPLSLALFGAGLLGLAMVRRKQPV